MVVHQWHQYLYLKSHSDEISASWFASRIKHEGCLLFRSPGLTKSLSWWERLNQRWVHVQVGRESSQVSFLVAVWKALFLRQSDTVVDDNRRNQVPENPRADRVSQREQILSICPFLSLFCGSSGTFHHDGIDGRLYDLTMTACMDGSRSVQAVKGRGTLCHACLSSARFTKVVRWACFLTAVGVRTWFPSSAEGKLLRDSNTRGAIAANTLWTYHSWSFQAGEPFVRHLFFQWWAVQNRE